MSAHSFGPRLTETGAIFRLWAPAAQRVDVVLGDQSHPLKPDDDGWFAAEVSDVKAGATYRFRIDGKTDVPDPGSHFQPNDIAGPSEVINHKAYPWRATDWRGRPWEETVLIETHVGTFTPQGTYRAMIDKLDHLVATGITALELMPLADFAGKRNWGYDGVLWYAPDAMFGRPDDLKALIDEAHLRGLTVFLDVVYNHFGPEGNYIGQYAPSFFGDAHTPWGSAINYHLPEVRAYAIENAVAWLRDYRFDGLRLDAVHAIPEQGEIPMLHELSREVGKLAADTGRLIHLVLENDDNRATLLDPATNPPRGKYRAQWNDDYHHAWHVLLTGEDKGYYSDYAPKPLDHIVRALGSGFAYQGQSSAHRDGAPRGEPSGELAPAAFVNFLQNHDQIGNRALGDRLETLAKPEAIEAALAITLLAPMVPMLFQGEEWGSKVPFPFFCDFEGDLANAVRNGRKKEFASAYEKYRDEIPDPLDESSFRSAFVDWDNRETTVGKTRLTLVRELLALRKQHIVPRLAGARFGQAEASDDGLLTAFWTMGDGSRLHLMANLSDKAVNAAPPSTGTTIWGNTTTGVGTPWSVVWRIGDR
ncbi:malto-oligosyltrehalose trehalohydrolase [Tardiphaga sp. 37S4]|uniref:malto-oligosyltrehalose trehalohydrolase n=1 Tax=Tardiphaga TaxID=1395974 RepID=UPI001E54748F|nr:MULTISPECIES: malto-oligosyltrehalose trehalohydrolase [Tardiphaga]MDR6661520.1 1,4-alpha-glucan branching enzyme/maltooligosyltrehalose trehalohydrolase [Tardiphaga robiniae]UFS73693.1 malto-oligosyltrehalose trehalohydrolase [Tardiphaga sp. 37S4]